MILTAIIEGGRVNAVLAWIVVGILTLAAVASAVSGGVAWSVLAGIAVGIALVPAVSFRDRSVMPPWEVLVLVVLPTASRFLALPDAAADTATFLGIVGLSVLIVVEFHVFSPMAMPSWFAAVLVVLLTMATAGVWSIVQFAADAALGTTLIEGKTALMWDMVIATGVSVLGSPLLARYFERQVDGSEEPFRARASTNPGGGGP
ncbi:MAG: hypothetical protein BRD24_04275 [Halobacteriales archaeon SW_9_67_24]|nr:MAG: hypothetical protein BRD24_04275 [Halobacteriales archaeon SW_9_67_24]